MDHFHNVVGGQAGVFNVRHLVAAFIHHGRSILDKSVGLGVVVEFGAGIGVGDGDLDGFAIKGLGEVDGIPDRLLGFAGKPEDEVGMDGEAELVAVARKIAGPLDGSALLHVFQNLRVAGLEAHDQQPAAGFAHGLQRLIICGHAGGATPGQSQRLELFAQLDSADFLNVKGVIVEEELLDIGEVLLRPGQFRGNVVRGPLAPGVPAQRLRPQAEGALCGAAARGVESDKRMQQEGNAIAGNVHIPLVDFGGPGHGVQVFHLRPVGIMDDVAVELVADS